MQNRAAPKRSGGGSRRAQTFAPPLALSAPDLSRAADMIPLNVGYWIPSGSRGFPAKIERRVAAQTPCDLSK
jgi:hypothetical protein